jgi:hypothetical protein
MKIITDLHDLKKGDSVIIKYSEKYDKKGHSRISGDIFYITHPEFTIKCIETEEIEKIDFNGVKVYLVTGY